MKCGDLPWPLQPKLLRVLQEKELSRLGSAVRIASTCRLVAGNAIEDLAETVKRNEFRSGSVLR